MSDDCSPSDSRYQPFPKTGPLRANLNLTREQLKERLHGIEGQLYAYVMTTVKRAGEGLIQTGSGPNFQGGRITLTTCKHSMRTAKRNQEEWKNVWVAGLTATNVGGPDGNYLFYLTRIERPFASQRDLWLWLQEHAPTVAVAKATDKHRLGDLYHPTDLAGDPFDPASYATPRRDHIHYREGHWRDDIAYVYALNGRHPALLLGAPEDTYLWSEPRVRFPIRVFRGYRTLDLSFLLR